MGQIVRLLRVEAMDDIYTDLHVCRETWRYTGPFTRRNRLRGIFPGFFWGAGAFGLYLAYEAVFLRDAHGHHNDETGHGKEGH